MGDRERGDGRNFTSLARSPIWELQRRFFAESGIGAWRDNVVPSYVTTNAFIAGAYADIVAAWMADGGVKEVCVVELGAGSGRLARAFLSQLEDAVGTDAMTGVRYVLTDIADEQLAFLREHPTLQAAFDAGLLDLARFRAGIDDGMHLAVSGADLAPEQPVPALVVIANYVFDGIEQDLFRTEKGKLFERAVRLRPPSTEATVGNVELDWKDRPLRLEVTPYYRDARSNDLLRAYRDGLTEGTFSIPVGGLRAASQLRALASSRFLMLSSDKGYVRLKEIEGRTASLPATHGSLSFAVNYHAMLESAATDGARIFTLPRSDERLQTIAIAHGEGSLGRTRRVFHEAFDELSPYDFLRLKHEAVSRAERFDMASLLDHLCLGRWDPVLLSKCYDPLVALLPNTTEDERNLLAAGLAATWERYLPIGNDEDLAFLIGNLFAGMNRPREALPFLEASRRAFGDDEATLQNISRCRSMLDESKS